MRRTCAIQSSIPHAAGRHAPRIAFASRYRSLYSIALGRGRVIMIAKIHDSMQFLCNPLCRRFSASQACCLSASGHRRQHPLAQQAQPRFLAQSVRSAQFHAPGAGLEYGVHLLRHVVRTAGKRELL